MMIPMSLKNFIITFSLLCMTFHMNAEVPVNYLQVSEDLMMAIYTNSSDVPYLKTTLAKADENQLAAQLGTDAQKNAFWVNIYNAYILDILTENPEKYNNRRQFFNEKQVLIAQKNLSFSDIEHGILRRSKNQYSLGYLRKWFVNSFEKKMRVDKVDYRIHFALNCGAKSCPPVNIYSWTTIDEQFAASTINYLRKSSTYSAEKRTAYVTSLFNGFRKDFGGLKGIKNILKKHHIIPDTDVKIVHSEYDWTLDLNNFSPSIKAKNQ
jgi:hypothetical protein